MTVPPTRWQEGH